jgi:hypothetical protein
MAVAQAFAAECVVRGDASDRLLFAMAALSADDAPGASAKEFLPMCGVIGLGARAAEDGGMRAKALARLHDAAEDVRFRVRDAAVFALATIGAARGDALVRDVASWMDGYFQAAAVLAALADQRWLVAIDDGAAAAARLDDAWKLARDAPRAAARWPGRKALVEMLGTTPAALASRFGVPVFDLLVSWTKIEQPELREAIEKNLRGTKMAGRFADEVARVRAALDASAAAPRDPTRIVQGTRGRGKKRR